MLSTHEDPQYPIPALTCSQPFASLIVDGPKRIETRVWRTRHRGWMAIHVSRRDSYKTLQMSIPEWDCDENYRGKVIAVAWLEDVVRCGEVNADYRERMLGDFSGDRWAWILGEVRRIGPVPAMGRLGLWSWSP